MGSTYLRHRMKTLCLFLGVPLAILIFLNQETKAQSLDDYEILLRNTRETEKTKTKNKIGSRKLKKMMSKKATKSKIRELEKNKKKKYRDIKNKKQKKKKGQKQRKKQ